LVTTCASCAPIPALSSCATTFASRSTLKSTKFTISPALPHPFTISSIPFRRPRPVSTRHQHARPRQAREGEDSASIHVGDLWRSVHSPANRGLLGQRQSDRAALLLR